MPKTKKQTSLKENPKAVAALDEAITSSLFEKASRPSITGIKKLLGSKETKDAMLQIIDLSSMNEAYKKFLRLVFIEGVGKESALNKISPALGKEFDPVAKNATINNILQHPEVKDFLEMLKLWYVQVAPVAALTEVDIMLSLTTPADVKLKAAQSVLKRGGMGDDEGKKDTLPVMVNIIMPPQVQETQIPEIKITEVENGK